MIEHNNNEYLKLIQVLYKLKICYCLNCLMNDTLESVISNELKVYIEQNSNNNTSKKTNNNVESTQYDTKDMSIKFEHSNYDDKSMQTATIAKSDQL